MKLYLKDSLSEERIYVKSFSSGMNINFSTTTNILISSNVSIPSVEFKYREDDNSVKSWTVFYKKVGYLYFTFECAAIIMYFNSIKY